MREYRPIVNQKKQKPSRFFESFIQSKGPNGVARASIGEIQRSLKSFFLDLAYGNIVQEKYMDMIRSDPRVIQEAAVEAENKMVEANVILQSLDCAMQCGLPIITLPAFNGIHNKFMMRANTYGIILGGLRDFMMSGGDEAHLVSISTKLNSVIMKGSKQQLML